MITKLSNKGPLLLVIALLATTFPTSASAEDDEKLLAAWHSANKVKEAEQIVESRLEEIAKYLNYAKPPSLAETRQTISRLKKIVPHLLTQAEWIVTTKPYFDKECFVLHRALREAAEKFAQAADECVMHAEAESEASLVEHYRMLAQHTRESGALMLRRADHLKTQCAGIDKRVEFVRRTLLFLKRLEIWLKFYPSEEQGDRIQTYLTQLDSYLKQFQTTVTYMKKLRLAKDIPPPKARSKTSDKNERSRSVAARGTAFRRKSIDRR